MKVSKELVDKRREEVMRYIQEVNNISVNDLVKKFDVSPVTIRRDLQYWEDIGAIERHYGSAALIEKYVSDGKEYDRYRYMTAIAKRAAAFVQDNDVIFINSSATAKMVVDYIKHHKNVTIITNNAKMINVESLEDIQVVFTGGEVRYPKNSMVGDIALKTIRSINANKCFIGCSGLSAKGISTGLLKETSVNKTMLDQTKGQKFILCDHTKFGLDYSFKYCDFGDVDYLITDVEADQNILNDIQLKSSIEIIKVAPAVRK